MIGDFTKYLNKRRLMEQLLLPPHRNEEEEEEDDDDDDENDAKSWYNQQDMEEGEDQSSRLGYSSRGPRKRIDDSNRVYADGFDMEDGNLFPDGPPNPGKSVINFGFDSLFENAHYDVKNLAVLINQFLESNRTLKIKDNENDTFFNPEGDIEVVGLLKRENYRNKKFDYDCLLIRELEDNSMYVFSTETDHKEKKQYSFIFTHK